MAIDRAETVDIDNIQPFVLGVPARRVILQGSCPMKFLLAVIRHVHFFIGISTPPPDQEKFLLAVWLGIIALLVGGFLFLLYLPALLRG